jgi:hypothetical protein
MDVVGIGAEFCQSLMLMELVRGALVIDSQSGWEPQPNIAGRLVGPYTDLGRSK